MKIFKITNITNQAGKRDLKFNSILDIDYVTGMKKQSIKLKAGETIFLKTDSLELSVQKLRVNGLITIMEISEAELNESINAKKPKVIEKPIENDAIQKKENVKSKPNFGHKKKNENEA